MRATPSCASACVRTNNTPDVARISVEEALGRRSGEFRVPRNLARCLSAEIAPRAAAPCALKSIECHELPAIPYSSYPNSARRLLPQRATGSIGSNGPRGIRWEATCKVPAERGDSPERRRPSASSAEIRATSGVLFCSDTCASTRWRARPSKEFRISQKFTHDSV